MQLHTTRSWDFMGLTLDFSSEVTPLQLAYGDDIVVGIFDTGIWPESESFQEEPDLGHVSRTWKGKCVQGEEFDPATACNQKLIGARFYYKGFEQAFGPLKEASGNLEYKSARGYLGHGTHTASTAVGSIVKNASFLDLGQGVARGGAPRARLAVYKVCWSLKVDNDMAPDDKCTDADVIKAFDDALHDGVHVISASFGSTPPTAPFWNYSADIGSFHAMQKGVSVVFSAGNDGPDPSLVTNVAPWSICVAASSLDRAFPAQIILDNNISFTGESLIAEAISDARLVGAKRYFDQGICKLDRWNNRTATRRDVVLCFSTTGSVEGGEAVEAVSKAKASGLIFVEPLSRQIADVDAIPTVRIDIIQGTKIRHYLAQSRSYPKVQILPSKTVIKKSPAPKVAYFSSRGPGSLSPDILKPDVTAPGINILAAWPPQTPPTFLPTDTRSVEWNFQSGTSMSCPHVSGVVALIKSVHPDWSPAAIKSALMTTGRKDKTYTRDTTDDIILAGSMKASDPFDIGAGHIDPLKAMDPGLVYDLKTHDYILYLCNIGFTQDQIQRMVILSPGTSTACPKGHKTNTNINYPSITVSSLQSAMTIKRTVRNVGHRKTAIYFARIVNPDGVEVVVWPRVLFFSCFKEEAFYFVTLKPVKTSQGRYDFGEIVWSDGSHHVRSPLVVCVNTITTAPPSSATTVNTGGSVPHASV
ncbi:hypothetical protein RJ640_013229 [Escallonia rubra]|uniref:Uncharacterized protein n=1 Tax=Escallonia rubra TaxID=112253 RepID=A0AA88UEL4_9ASTE|nr:hypothetical protein RJ640_013229 [Escallonia rubra]